MFDDASKMRAVARGTLLVLASANLPLSAGHAQLTETKEQPCHVVQQSADGRGTVGSTNNLIFVVCGKTGALIGPGQSYLSSYNSALKTLLVAVEQDGKTRVLLAVASDGDRLRVDDLSRELARSSGRMPDRGLERDVLDVSAFAATGTVVVMAAKTRGTTAPSVPALLERNAMPNRAAVATTIDLRDFVAAARQAGDLER